ncbi:MAG: hypothetical protein COV29_03270 [Candidatus Yanofskybacteria bacterium CG10_big_fil_rev_8_21_14_0_10_36_16]|uniref:Uncharacterized protein n=1 Tax=Candidatus Yanofskybacteria bacterium CG10_big_fil_rev_8_21_14_0_10_36_16 TaxID=1975096 RepID=A0A2J0Q701_9BACT|nr:MAG: hypothetical protein COV29_03270 [Candidatus Yanofskybacteria bacterium CG10_big_fil_rev_8_21_14_0_10_36_16]
MRNWLNIIVKKIFVSSLIALFLVPVFVFAHGGMMLDFDEVGDGYNMMRYVEDQAVGDEIHEEMEDLMTKMMSGTMTEEEADRMVELMDEYPGPHGMMMGRFMNSDDYGDGWNMMSRGHHWGLGGFWFSLMCVIHLVWLVVGVLAIVWLWKNINKK